MDAESLTRPPSAPPACRWAPHLAKQSGAPAKSPSPPPCRWANEPPRKGSGQSIASLVTIQDRGRLHSGCPTNTEGWREGDMEEGDEGLDESTLMQELLSRQLLLVQRLLMGQHERAQRLAARHADALSTAEADVADLQHENLQLRDKLVTAGLSASFSGRSETGGTGGDSRSDAVAKKGQVPCQLKFLKGSEREFFDSGPRPLLLGPTSRPSSRAGAASGPLAIWDGGNRSASPMPNPPPRLPQQPPLPDVTQELDLDVALPGFIGSYSGAAHDAGTVALCPPPPLEEAMWARRSSFPAEVEASFQLLTTWWQQKTVEPQSKSDYRPPTSFGILGVVPAASPSPTPMFFGADKEKHCSFTDKEKTVTHNPWTAPCEEQSETSNTSVASSESQVSLLGLSNRPQKSKRVGKVVEIGKDGKETGRMVLKEAPQPVFADAAAMKEKLRKAIGRREYNVADFYHTEGIWQLIARHRAFENLTLFVIAFNALWIWIDTDYNKSDVLLEAMWPFQLVENSFCAFFLLEWIVRFMSFRRKRHGLRDAWFVFDTTLVYIMVIETWVFSALIIFMGKEGSKGFLGNASALKLLRLIRLSRMARMARLLKAMPELMIMIKGMAVAMRSVFFTLFLLLCIVYIFAIAFVQMLGPRGALAPSEVGVARFPNVWAAMKTLAIGGTMPDQEELVLDVGGEHFMTGVMIMLFILLGSLTVMNMLVGVLCEVVSVVSAVEKETLLVSFTKSQLQGLLVANGFDKDGDGKISKDEFESLLADQDGAARALQDLGVDCVGLVDYMDVIFVGDRSLTFSEFMEVVLQLRGSNTATVKDIVDLRKVVLTEIEKVRGLEKSIVKRLDKELRGQSQTGKSGSMSAR